MYFCSKFNNILIYILLLVLIICILFYCNKSLKENFDGNNYSLTFQTGLSPITQSGTIQFTKPFNSPPTIFTQIQGTSDTVSNTYSVQVLNITNSSFDYSKNKLVNQPSGQYNALMMSPSISEKFTWIAFG